VAHACPARIAEREPVIGAWAHLDRDKALAAARALDFTTPALTSHDGRYCVQLPPARGCYHLAPQRTFTSNPVIMPAHPCAGLSIWRPSWD
jgi:hypothetical protein